jgi:hypothetical protein
MIDKHVIGAFNNGQTNVHHEGGITLREWLAGQANAGCAFNVTATNVNSIASHAVQLADAVLLSLAQTRREIVYCEQCRGKSYPGACPACSFKGDEPEDGVDLANLPTF